MKDDAMGHAWRYVTVHCRLCSQGDRPAALTSTGYRHFVSLIAISLIAISSIVIHLSL